MAAHRLSLVGRQDAPAVGGEGHHVGQVPGLQDLDVVVAEVAPAEEEENKVCVWPRAGKRALSLLLV